MPTAQLAADARCIAPAKPGGGFDLTCRLLVEALCGRAGESPASALRTVYQPGGIGALAFRNTLMQRPADAGMLMAFSSGSLLNLAQGRFGPYSERDVQWVAGVAMGWGVLAVHKDAPYQSLADLARAMRDQPGRLVFGAGGSIGSQGWMKAALLNRVAGLNHKNMRFVAYERGGEALGALAGGHVQVVAGDAAEVSVQMDQGAPVKVLAILAPTRRGRRWAFSSHRPGTRLRRAMAYFARRVRRARGASRPHRALAGRDRHWHGQFGGPARAQAGRLGRHGAQLQRVAGPHLDPDVDLQGAG
ncbi:MULTISPECIES: tripartite tricarboxylate transporter substrate-binding protein [unclassified Acidovorax]|uniref:tripartite tricarboxylate transporter substrate-binding protein n=1 Tax=unclassified Acidovorax TaxID=2684926 RepID=UPI0028830233|nr:MULTISPECIES: tripartite tricarboxylate transporter substrate-binding protein [unclassified Acidovorax]